MYVCMCVVAAFAATVVLCMCAALCTAVLLWGLLCILGLQQVSYFLH